MEREFFNVRFLYIQDFGYMPHHCVQKFPLHVIFLYKSHSSTHKISLYARFLYLANSSAYQSSLSLPDAIRSAFFNRFPCVPQSITRHIHSHARSHKISPFYTSHSSTCHIPQHTKFIFFIGKIQKLDSLSSQASLRVRFLNTS